MSEETSMIVPRASNMAGVLILLAAMPALALALNALAGPVVTAIVCGLYGVALILTVLAERNDDTTSRDPSTGLPDRAAAIARLEKIFEQRLAGSSQAAVFVISIAESPDEENPPDEHDPVPFIAIARLAQGLRRGDQIIRIGEHSLAAILGPTRGMTAGAAESILDRIDGMFREPLRVGSRSITLRVSLGACLQHDAPRADAISWLEAAELAALVAGEEDEPLLFPSGATKVERSVWDASPELLGREREASRKNSPTQRADDPVTARHDRRQRRA